MKKITFNIAVLIALLLTANGAFAQVPTITSFAPTSGSVGTTVTITGSNFNASFTNNIVFFGATKATVSAGSATSLTVTVPIGASYQPISVTNIITGLSAYSAQRFITTFACGGSFNTSSFATKVDNTTGTQPYSVSTGDFDGDGKTDLAVVNNGSNTVSVFRNTGSSGTISFAAKVDFTTGTNPISVSTGDFDGDGKADLAVAIGNSATVSVFRNTGSSGTVSFAAKVDFTTGAGPNSVSTGDFDGDGKPDFVVAHNSTSGTVSVLKNTSISGTISFATKVDFTVDFNTIISPNSVSTGDFDGDGKTDLAVTNKTFNTVSVFRNTVIVPTVTASATATTICTGASITLTAGGTADTYTWLGGVTNGVGFVPPTGTNTYTVTGTITATGCQNTATKTITVNPLPTVTVNATATTVCAGTSITLTGGGTANTYTWTGGVTNGVGFVPPTGTTTYTVTGTITATGCQNTAIKTITVNPLPTVTANATATTVCAGASITLTGGGTANTYAWSGGVTNSVGFAPPTGTTTYTVTGTITATGCQNTATKAITVNPLPISTISATENTKCSGSCNGTATVNVTSGTPPYSFLWSNGQTTDIASSLCQGNYGVVVTDINGCNSANNITVNVSAIANSNIYLTNLAAIDQINISPSFAAFYTYNLPASITAPPSNPRNFVDPGKKARFKVECTNEKVNGQSIVSGICKVRSNNPYITITDSSSALNNIGWNDKAWSADEFEINIDPNTPPGTNAYIDFIVQESGQEYSTTCIAIPITPLVYSATTPFTIDDDNNPDSQGNDNDICDANEIIEFYPWLDNISTLDAEFVRGRFENLDNLSYINIWNGVPGINTTVYDAGWWNYSFAQPQTVASNSLNTTPEYDFVFNYNNTNIINNFNLYMVMAGGFKLFSGNALSLVQWSLPYTFSASGSVSIGSALDNKDYLNVYPNPTNDLIMIENKNDKLASPYVILNSLGKQVLTGKLIGATTTVDINHLSSGIYLLQVGETEKRSFKLIKK